MKKLLVLGMVLGFSILLLSLVYAQNETCTDTDGGINLYQKGEIKYFYDVPTNEFYGWHTTEDVCNSDGTLTEFACELYNSTELHPSKKYDCPNGCSDGACIQSNQTITCKDSDGGKDYYEKGVIRGQNEDDPIKQITSASDTCNGDILYEFICKNSEEYDDETYACPNGCEDGACISPDQTAVCKDSDNGLNYYVKGKCVSGKINSAEEELFDACISNGPYAGEIREAYCNEENKCSFQPFKCENGCKEGVCLGGEVDINEIEKKGFKHAYFQCYDGEESGSTGREACKSAEYWQKFAEQFCESHCKKTGEVEKCGVNTFSVGAECYLDEEESETEIIESVTFDEEVLVCKNSCPLDEKCYPFGYRKAGKYCSDEGKFVGQGGESCDNNFECKSNVCVDGKCISGNLIQKIIEWFKRLFG